MSASQLLAVLKARWRCAALVFLAVLALAGAVTAVLPKQYTATASVVLDVKSTDPIAGAGIQPLAIASYMATQADLIASEPVVVNALQALKADQDPRNVAKWRDATHGQGQLLPWLAEQTLKKFEVLPYRDSNILAVTFTAPTPQGAADTANAIVRSYISTTLGLRSDPARQYNRFFDARAKQLRDAVEQAQARLTAYQREVGVVASDEKLDVENSRLSELSSQLVAAQAAAGESGSRSLYGQRSGERSPDVLSNPVISGLNGDMAQKKARLNELRARFGDQYPDVETLRANIDELQQRINAETRRVVSSLAVTNRVNESKVAQTRGELEVQRAKVLRIKAQRDQAAVLQRDVDNANQAYSAIYTQVSQSMLESQATQTNVSPLQVASPPALPSRPKVLLNLAVALILGTVLGAATALIRERRDRRLRSDDDVELLLGQPLLGRLASAAHTLPDARAKRLAFWRTPALRGA